ncbi:hypothetical protein P280DRAFT_553645 [Massarina eburnea CBS 473.64]|uniref:Biotrophy-associated secreted protein 2 n=1 Tax=Massarina eburnea CBS 473.64 TaxID=1395130 RepID=A0A6A6RK81_9PLEO|nr:hypothetical protein P280DRAFT_553645 [Massarina eburnea CBS 473.64]
MRFTIAAFITLAATAAALAPNDAGAKNVGAGDSSQFITGGCVSDADCSSGCCADLSGVGICSAEAAANQAGKAGCGFQDPNSQATISAAKAQVQKQGFKRYVKSE